MKKLTAGIFTVLIGLCAANSADAAIASKAWVEQDFVKGATYATDKAGLETAISDAKSGAEATAAGALAAAKEELEGKITAEETARKAADKDITDFVGTLPEGATASTIVGYITEKTSGIATDAALSELQSTVSTNTINIGNNADAIATISGDANTVGSFAKAVADSINALSAENGAIKIVADDLAEHEQFAEQTYATKTEVNAKQDKLTAGDHVTIVTENGVTTIDAKISDDAVADPAAQKVMAPSFNRTQLMINDSMMDSTSDIAALKLLVGETAVSAQINTAVEGLTEGAIKTNADDIDALEGRMNTAEGDIDNLEKALNDETDGLIKKVAENAAKAAQNAADVATNAAAIAQNTASIASHSTAISDNTTAISNEVTRATEAEAALQTAINTKLTAKTSVNSGIVTTDADGDIIPVAPAACENMLNYCVLTYGRASEAAEPGYIWEVVTRDGEGK